MSALIHELRNISIRQSRENITKYTLDKIFIELFYFAVFIGILIYIYTYYWSLDSWNWELLLIKLETNKLSKLSLNSNRLL